jgi:hypothetical protein
MKTTHIVCIIYHMFDNITIMNGEQYKQQLDRYIREEKDFVPAKEDINKNFSTYLNKLFTDILLNCADLPSFNDVNRDILKDKLLRGIARSMSIGGYIKVSLSSEEKSCVYCYAERIKPIQTTDVKEFSEELPYALTRNNYRNYFSLMLLPHTITLPDGTDCDVWIDKTLYGNVVSCDIWIRCHK